MKKLIYIWHDCFVYEDSLMTIIFDYWMDPTCGSDLIPNFIKHTDKSKPVYVFVSHHHKDHYTKQIFEWSKIFKNIKYVISRDVAKYARHILTPDSIYKGVKPSPESIVVISKGETYKDDLINVEAYASTDIGNSYMLNIRGRNIFHAGDLNAWIWRDESTNEEVEEALHDFESILNTIADRYPKIDMAMFPVDSRIGSEYYIGAKLFVRKIDVTHFFPMHFGLGDTPIQQLKYQHDATCTEKYANPERGEYICLQAPYASFSIP